MKTCTCCNQAKDTTEFQQRKASKDGLTASCKSCLKERDSKRYAKEKHTRAERQKIYMQSDAGKAAHNKAAKAWRDKNSTKRAAHVILGNALKYGRISKQPCFVCGKNAEAHHPDYDRPLDVVWLCKHHHLETHKMIGKPWKT